LCCSRRALCRRPRVRPRVRVRVRVRVRIRIRVRARVAQTAHHGAGARALPLDPNA
jgi:hypothetical protein